MIAGEVRPRVPAPQVVQGARSAATRMADRETPFIFDEWYVVAYGEELRDALLRRTVLDRPLVLYRTSDGTAVAFDDRCVHRSFPLSSGLLENDTIVCGYHGIRYDASGEVIDVPSQRSCPKGLRVRSYPLHETGPLTWIWMGDPEAADPAKVPAPSWLTSTAWVWTKTYFELECNYVSLHENLLDLTHLSFLHGKSFGTPDYAKAPYEVTVRDGYFALERRIVPTSLPPVWSKPTGLGTAKAGRVAKSEFLTPGMHLVTASVYDSELAEDERTTFTISTCHMPTPQTHASTHYFIVNGRSFGLNDPEVTESMDGGLFKVFEEDVVGLRELQRVLEHEDRRDDFFEISLAADRATIEMRQYLKRRALAPGA